MRNFLIAVVLGLTGLTFYSAFAYKSKVIEDDITKRVTDDLTASNAQGVGIDVDGRHVTLSGIVYDEAQEAAYLKTADDTYGALGPIDGLTYQADGGYIKAQKTDTGIALRGSVPNEAARASLLEAAAAATDGDVDDQLVISGPEADWQGEAQFGMQQLAALSAGAMTASAAGYVLSGTTDGDVAAVSAPVAEREGWSAFVSSPVVASGLQGQVADLNGQIAELTASNATITQERDDLDARLTALKDGMTDELVAGESLRAELQAARANLDTATATIAERDETIAAFTAEKSTLVSRTLDTDSKLAEVEGQLSGAKATIVALTAAQSVKDTTIRDLNGQVGKLETELANRQAALGSTDEQVAALRTEVAERDAGLEDANAKIVALNTELGGQDDTIDVLEAQVAEKDASLASAQETLATLKPKVTKLEAEVYTLNATVAARDTTIANLNDRLNDTSSNLQSDNARIAELAAMVQARDASLADTQVNVAALSSDVAAKDSDIGALTGQVNVLRGRVGTLTSRISDLEGEISTRDAALGDADAKVAALMDASAAKDTDVESLTGKVGELTAVIAARDATIASLRAQGSSSASVAEQCAAQASNVMEGARINFGSGNARITPESTILLERLTGIALACVGDDLTVEIGGHTDSQGSDAANKALSERRAQAVLNFMAARGVPANGVRAVGFGEGSPIADNNTAAGRAANRRITFEWQAR